jgi:hypothetical protein
MRRIAGMAFGVVAGGIAAAWTAAMLLIGWRFGSRRRD